MATQDKSAAAEDAENLILHTTDIVVSYVANNSIGAEEVQSLIRNVHATLAGLGAENKEDPRPDPAVSVRASVKSDHLVCLEDGKKFKMLKRHLMTDHGMTPGEYRARWDLPASYPMVASDYAEKRRDLAKKIGLGRKRANAPPGNRLRKCRRRRRAHPGRLLVLPGAAQSRRRPDQHMLLAERASLVTRSAEPQHPPLLRPLRRQRD